jgi:hypothetical protein
MRGFAKWATSSNQTKAKRLSRAYTTRLKKPVCPKLPYWRGV